MRAGTLTLRKALWLVCACVLLLPRFAAAQSPHSVDFDGDGQRDHFALDRGEAPLLRVWLSASDTTQFIRARHPLLQVVAVDLDGDHQPELVARDAKSHIHVWTRRQTRFHSVRPRKIANAALNDQHRHRLEHDDDDRPGAITNAPFVPPALVLSALPRAPGRDTSTSVASRQSPICQSLAGLSPFAPRPPPSRFQV